MMRVAFMGTPAFAVPSLQALLDAGHEVAAVITQPDRPSGRKMKPTAGLVHALALKQRVPVLQFERIRRQEGLDALRGLGADLFVTAAFGQILSQKVLDIPPFGTVNVHASLLPRYRGPAPVNWCILEGEAVAGVTTMQTDIGIDTGDVLLQRGIPIDPLETAGELTSRLSVLGAELLIETLRRIEEGTCPRTRQDEAQATRQPMLEKSHGRIDWAKSAGDVHNLIRGVNPWPGAWTFVPGVGILKIWAARPGAQEGEPGRVLRADSREGLAVACGEGSLDILELQAPGAKRMAADAYLRGHVLKTGLTLGAEES